MKNNQLSTRELLEQSVKAVAARQTPDKALKEQEKAAPVSAKQTDDISDADILTYAELSAPKAPDVSAGIKAEEMAVREVEVPERFRKDFAQKFSDLPSEWQQCLCEVDAQMNALVKELNETRGWLLSLRQMRCASTLSAQNESVREWVEKLAYMEHLLACAPQKALRILVQLYLKDAHPADCATTGMTAYFQSRRLEAATDWLNKCLSEKNEAGEEVFPHRNSVMKLVLKLLNNQMAPDIVSAYGLAVWMDENIREKMIDHAVKSKINDRIKAAEKLKKEIIIPEQCGIKAIEGGKAKSTRELLEEAFRKYQH